jgi:hypothetical protein
MDFIGTKYILKHFYANVRRQFLATISSSFLTSGSSVKDDIAIGESAFNLGFLKPFGHQIGFCLDLEDRDSVLEAYKVQTGPFFLLWITPKKFLATISSSFLRFGSSVKDDVASGTKTGAAED